MNFRSSRVTFDTPGTATIALPFTPTGVMAFVSPKGTTDSQNHSGQGAADGSLQNCTTTDAGGSRGYNDRIISIRESVSGTWTEVLRVEFVSFGTNQITFNVVTANSNYQAYMRYFG